MSLNKIVSYVAVVALVAVSVVMPVLVQAQTAMTVGIVTPVAGSTVMVGQTVTFTAQANGGNGIYSYGWDFGNNQQGSGRVFDQVYSVVGDYVVTVVAADTAGNTASANLAVHVVAGTNPNPTTLTISNVRVTDVTSNSAVVRWETNIPASSRVIYDTVSHASLGTAPNYGYANSTTVADTAPNGVTTHAVTVSGLAPATTYYFRAISQ